MNCWRVAAEPSPCPALGWGAGGVHLAVAAAPWVAGCQAWLALLLTGLALAGLPGVLAAVPGRLCPLRRLDCDDGGWTVRLGDGPAVAAEVVAGTRVMSGLVVCRLVAAGRHLEWWIPAYALSTDDFRRLKVALRCRGPAGSGPSC